VEIGEEEQKVEEEKRRVGQRRSDKKWGNLEGVADNSFRGHKWICLTQERYRKGIEKP